MGWVKRVRLPANPRRFPLLQYIQTASRVTQLSRQRVPGLFTVGKSSRSVKVSIYTHPVPGFRQSGAIPPRSYLRSCRGQLQSYVHKEIKRLDKETDGIGMTLNSAPPVFTRNGLSEDRCELWGKIMSLYSHKSCSIKHRNTNQSDTDVR
jgi:hypothetical protein